MIWEQNALQDEKEIDALANLVEEEGCRSICEIGAKFGGSIWRLAHKMPKGSRVVAVDLPKGTKAWAQSEPSLRECMRELRDEGYDAHLIWGDSTDPVIIEKVRELGPYDLLFLDGNHTFKYVNLDWDHYSPMARMIAFHDIAWHRAHTWVGVRIDVPQFWNWVKQHYHHREFRFDETKKNNGIGVVWLS